MRTSILNRLSDKQVGDKLKQMKRIILGVIILMAISKYTQAMNINGFKFSKITFLKENLSDTSSMFKPVPAELIVTEPVQDSDIVVVSTRCIVHITFSESELQQMEKHSRSVKEWEAFCDWYSFYNDDVSMYLYERENVITVKEKKYLRFVMTDGRRTTIDRMAAAGKLFFFNPVKGVTQCNSSDFDSRKYRKF